jgi:thiol-disulfide isomerase/thioredoxin
MMSRRKVLIGLQSIVLIAAVGLLAQRLLPVKADSGKNEVQTFSLTGLDGNRIQASQFKGKAIVLNFWAPWCPPCKLEIPWLQKLQEDNKGKLVVIGVVADESEYARAAQFMKAKGITYLLARQSQSLIDTFGDASSLPTTYYISPSRHVVHTVLGLAPQYMMRRYAQDAISAN